MQQRLILGVIATILLAARPGMTDSRVSIEVGGVIANSPLDGKASLEVGAQRNGLTTSATTTSNGVTSGSKLAATFAAFELRPTFFLAGGWRLGVGFRTGKTLNGGRAAGANPSASVAGGDVSFGYGRVLGRFAPFAEVRFGFNSFDSVGISQTGHRRQLRLDGVIGARLYLGRSMYVQASAFGGLGDRYGGSLALGFDIVHYRWRGALP